MPSIKTFQKTVLEYYAKNGRDLPWRKTTDPYAIVVSEIMLQQTQADRVLPKYFTWLAHFPTFESLAHGSLTEVLRLWQGLGYNRRAIYLQKLARRIIDEYGGAFPTDPQLATTLPGIGPATAAAVITYAFNLPVPFIETNVRCVFIHFFFPERTDVTDDELWPLVVKATPRENPREWYNALMDYGVKLKKEFKNPSRKSAHHVKQSKFEGSNRQLRGKMVKLLIDRPDLTAKEISVRLEAPLAVVRQNLLKLRAEGFTPTEDAS